MIEKKRNAIRCLIIDDEPLAVDLIRSHIAQISRLELVSSFHNALEAFTFLKANSVDLIFLDIQMPVLTGIDFVKSLPSKPAIIFTTAYRDYAAESYELDVIDYLVKPITFIRFFKAVNKFMDGFNASKQHSLIPTPVMGDHIYVNANKKHIKVAFNEIESLKDYLRIHTEEKSIITKDKISDFEKKLPSAFLRIHRSFIVNTAKITAFTAQDVEIGLKEIPIGRSYKEIVQDRLK